METVEQTKNGNLKYEAYFISIDEMISEICI